jgi:hypothetical protein
LFICYFTEGDETIFVLPDELKCDEEVSGIKKTNINRRIRISL